MKVSFVIFHFSYICIGSNEDSDARKKKRRSRWGGSEHDKIFIPGMPTILPPNLGKDQEQAYLRKLIFLILCKLE